MSHINPRVYNVYFNLHNSLDYMPRCCFMYDFEYATKEILFIYTH